MAWACVSNTPFGVTPTSGTVAGDYGSALSASSGGHMQRAPDPAMLSTPSNNWRSVMDCNDNMQDFLKHLMWNSSCK